MNVLLFLYFYLLLLFIYTCSIVVCLVCSYHFSDGFIQSTLSSFSGPYDPYNPYPIYDPSVYSPSFNWRAQYRSGEDLESAESREPLSPDYKDPKKLSRGPPSKPSFDDGVLPGGVLDVDAVDGFANPAGIPGLGSDFGFGIGSHGGLPRRPNSGGLFGFGSFFGPSMGDYQPWWKG